MVEENLEKENLELEAPQPELPSPGAVNPFTQMQKQLNKRAGGEAMDRQDYFAAAMIQGLAAHHGRIGHDHIIAVRHASHALIVELAK